jgi:hypothetical protein
VQNVVERAVILSETETSVVDDSWLERAPVDSPLPHDEFRCWPTGSWKSSKRLLPRATASLARLPVGREPSEVARDLDKQIEFLFIEIAC